MTVTMDQAAERIEAGPSLTAGSAMRAARARQRRADDLRRLAEDLGQSLEPLRVATLRRAAEAELTGAALVAVAEGLGAEPVETAA